MSDKNSKEKKHRESIFLSEHFMLAACAVVVITSLASLVLCIRDGWPSNSTNGMWPRGSWAACSSA